MTEPGSAFLECPKCGSPHQYLTRIGRLQFECLACTALFDVAPAGDAEPRAKPSGRVKAMQTGRKDQDE